MTCLDPLAGEEAGELHSIPFPPQERRFLFSVGRKFEVRRDDKGPEVGKSPGYEL